MTPKEKAIELVEKFNNYCSYEWWEGNNGHKENMKQCALIAVDELINEVYNISHQYTAVYNNETKFYNYTDSKELKFWKEVKHEIEKL
jgi:hypothetical protein